MIANKIANTEKHRTTRRYSGLAAAACAATLVLSACSSSGDASTGGSSGGACDAKDPVLFGALGPLSGPAAEIGALLKNGYEMGVKDVNAAGGVSGKCVKLLMEDDGADPTKAAQSARKLLDQDQVDGFVGPLLSGPAGSVLPLTTAAKISQVVDAALSGAGDASKYPYAFQMTATTEVLVATYIDYMKKAGLTKVGVLAVNNPYGTGLVAALKKQLPGTGLTLAASEYVPSGGVDYGPAMTKVKSSGAEAILSFTATDPDNISVVKARNALDWNAPVLGSQTFSDPPVLKAIGQKGMDGVLVATNLLLSREIGSDSPVGGAPAEKFRDDYKVKLKNPSFDGSVYIPALSYDSVEMLAKAFNATKSTDAARVCKYLEDNGYAGVAAKYVFTRSNHSGVTPESMVMTVAGSGKGSFLQLAPKAK